MTKELKSLLERAARWPREVQDEAADGLRAIEAGYRGAYEFTAEDKAALERSAKDVHRKKFASSKKVAAFFKRVRA